MFRLNKVSKKYKKGQVALNEVSFVIKEGECVGLVGSNGSGKTTTINLLFNLIQPSSGSISYGDRPYSPGFSSFKKEVGVVMSTPYFVDIFTIREYWDFVGEMQEVSKAERRKRITDLLSFLDFSDRDLPKKINDLSSGMQAKVSIGAALIHNPKTLVLDEPFVNLDPGTLETIKQLLIRLKSTKTILITSHHIDLVLEICDRFLILDNGSLSADVNKGDYENEEELRSSIKSIVVKSAAQSSPEWLV